MPTICTESGYSTRSPDSGQNCRVIDALLPHCCHPGKGENRQDKAALASDLWRPTREIAFARGGRIGQRPFSHLPAEMAPLPLGPQTTYLGRQPSTVPTVNPPASHLPLVHPPRPPQASEPVGAACPHSLGLTREDCSVTFRHSHTRYSSVPVSSEKQSFTVTYIPEQILVDREQQPCPEESRCMGIMMFLTPMWAKA